MAVRKKRRRVTEEEIEDQRLEIEEDDSDDLPEIKMTGREARSLRAFDDTVPVSGIYELRVGKYTYTKPTEDRPVAGVNIYFKILDGPCERPEDGWPTVRDWIKMYHKPTDGQKKSMRIDLGRFWSLYEAAVGEMDPDQEYDFWECLEELKGCDVKAKITLDKDGDRVYQRFEYRPA